MPTLCDRIGLGMLQKQYQKTHLPLGLRDQREEQNIHWSPNHDQYRQIAMQVRFSSELIRLAVLFLLTQELPWTSKPLQVNIINNLKLVAVYNGAYTERGGGGKIWG